jgi:hypothetical protein
MAYISPEGECHGWNKPDGVEFKRFGVIAIANAIPDMRALSSLNLATNGLYAEGTKLLAEVLKGNKIMTELNISDNSATWDGTKHGDMSGIIALADAIPIMGAMTRLDARVNNIEGKGKRALQQAAGSRCRT